MTDQPCAQCTKTENKVKTYLQSPSAIRFDIDEHDEQSGM